VRERLGGGLAAGQGHSHQSPIIFLQDADENKVAHVTVTAGRSL